MNVSCFLEQFKAYKQAMVKHSQAQDDYKVLMSSKLQNNSAA